MPFQKSGGTFEYNEGTWSRKNKKIYLENSIPQKIQIAVHEGEDSGSQLRFNYGGSTIENNSYVQINDAKDVCWIASGNCLFDIGKVDSFKIRVWNIYTSAPYLIKNHKANIISISILSDHKLSDRLFFKTAVGEITSTNMLLNLQFNEAPCTMGKIKFVKKRKEAQMIIH